MLPSSPQSFALSFFLPPPPLPFSSPSLPPHSLALRCLSHIVRRNTGGYFIYFPLRFLPQSLCSRISHLVSILVSITLVCLAASPSPSLSISLMLLSFSPSLSLSLLYTIISPSSVILLALPLCGSLSQHGTCM